MTTTIDLINAISEQTELEGTDLYEWFQEVRNHGAVHGVTGFTYYYEVDQWLAKNLHLTVRYLKETNADEGNDLYAIAAKGINRHFQWIGSDSVSGSDVYGSLNGYEEIDCCDQINWYLVCTVIEQVAHGLGQVQAELDWAVEAQPERPQEAL